MEDEKFFTIQLPPSKSISARTLIINALSGGACSLLNLSDCDDTVALMSNLNRAQNLNRAPNLNKVSNLVKVDTPVKADVGAAGTAMRFLTAYFAITPGKRLLTGSERMLKRPIGILVDALRKAGADIEYAGEEGFPPLLITGKQLQGGFISLDGSVSSQFVSALLMIAPLMTEGIQLHLAGTMVSRPYIDLTLNIMHRFGAKASILNTDNSSLITNHCTLFTVLPFPYTPPSEFRVEADWSAASYWYETVALSRDSSIEVALTGLHKDSWQGDAQIAPLFAHLGVRTEYGDQGVRLSKQARSCSGLDYDFTDMPDMVQTFVVTCCMLGIPFRFTGLRSLRIKETDRIEALCNEMSKLGFQLAAEGDDVLAWTGATEKREPTPLIETYKDHRMAMAFAPAAACLAEGVRIAEPQVVSKSYPAFWQDLAKAGFSISEEEGNNIHIIICGT